MDILDQAVSLGLPVQRQELISIDPAAVRLLSADSFAVPVALSSNVLEVLVDHIPTPAQFAALERASGLQVTVTVTTGELLQRARERAATLRSTQAGRSIRHLFERARNARAYSLTILAGELPAMTTPSGLQYLSDELPVSVEEVTTWHEDLLAGRQRNVVPDGPDVWKVFSSYEDGIPVLNLRRVPAHLPSADELGLPALASALASQDFGLVMICGKSGSGRSTTAAALAIRALVHQARPAAVISDMPERTLSFGQSMIWSLTVGVDSPDLPSAVDSALTSGAKVLVVDSLESNSLKVAASAAATGVLVFAVVPEADPILAVHGLVDAVGPSVAATILKGIVGAHLLSHDGSAVPVFEVIIATAPVAAAVASSPRMLPAAVEAQGAAYGVTFELALAMAVSSGSLDFDQARSQAGDKQRFDVAAGRLNVLLSSEQLDADAALLDASASSSAPPPRRRRRRGR